MEELSEKELEILQYVAVGLNNDEISSIVNSTVHTVKAHVSSIMKKFGVNNRTKVAYYAHRYNLVDDRDIPDI